MRARLISALGLALALAAPTARAAKAASPVATAPVAGTLVAAIPAASLANADLPAATATVSTPPPRRLTLEQAIAAAGSESPSALAARHRYRGAYWEFVTYKADFRPSLDFDGSPIDISRSIQRQTLPDGSDAFVRRSSANSSATLSLDKVISFTGGTLSLQSGLQRIEGLEGDRAISWQAKPVAVAFRQPLFAYNSLKWAKRVEPRRYRESRQQFIEDLEGITANTIQYYFDLLNSQTTLVDAIKDQANSDSLLAAARRREAQGQVSENEVLQAELASLNANLRLTRMRVDLESRQQRLARQLGMGEDVSFDLVPPTDIPVMVVDVELAKEQARRNRSQAMAFDRQLIEADRNIALAKSANGQGTLYATYGLTQSASQIDQLYRNPTTDQEASVGIQVPLLDWGRNKARVAVATSNREVVRRQVEQSRADFDRDVFVRVSQFEIQWQQLQVSGIADSVAQRRYQLISDRYLKGQGDFNSVQIAQNEKDNARRGYLDALRSYWAAYEDVRQATLYDFLRGEPIEPPAVGF